MTEASHDTFRITLLGSGAPPPRLDRFGPSTLVEVGKEKFIFDAGRGAMQRLHQLGIPFGDITGMFLTHHHSDHVVGFKIQYSNIPTLCSCSFGFQRHVSRTRSR
jgi:ribonuclease Z